MPRILPGIAIAVFFAAIAWPLIALAWVIGQQGVPPDGGFSFTQGQMLLLMRSILLALAGTAATLLVAILFFLLAADGKVSAGWLVIMAVGLLCPPTVLAFGWLRIFPGGLGPHIRCVLTWALWAWPVALMFLWAGWRRTGKAAYEAALLETTPIRALVRVVLPVLLPHGSLAAAVLFLVFFTEYGVPHAFGLRVYATELLTWAGQSSNLIDSLWPALPSIVVTVGVLACLPGLLSRFAHDTRDLQTSTGSRSRLGAVAMAAAALLIAVPLLGLCRPLTIGAFVETLQTYWADVLVSLAACLAAAVLILSMGTLATRGRAGRVFLAITVLVGTLPGSLVGEALVAAYNRPGFFWFYDRWPIVALAYAARFAWVGALGFYIAGRTRTELADQARVDGASETQILWGVIIRSSGPLLLATAAVGAALAMGEVSAATMVRAPQYDPIPLILLDKFHQFQDAMLISLSLILVVIAAACGVAISWAGSRFSK